MFGSVLCRVRATLKRAVVKEPPTSSSATTAQYFLTIQNPIKPRVTSIFLSSFSTTTTSDGNATYSDSSNSFVVSYLVNSCGLTQDQAISASEKLNFITKSNPDSVLTLLKTYGFTQPHISKLINKYPSILSFNPHKTLEPKFDFFNSKGIYGHELANFITNDPRILWYSFDKEIIPSFDILNTIVHSDQTVIEMIKQYSWILSTEGVKRLMANLEILRNEGVPETNILEYLIRHPRIFTRYEGSFKEEIVEKVKGMGSSDHIQTTILEAIHVLTSMSKRNWIKKINVYKRWGWSQDLIHTTFRKYPYCMKFSENKITSRVNFLVNEMGYDSLSIAEYPRAFCCSMEHRIIPRCSVIKILVSRGLMEEMISVTSLSTMADESFLKKFVEKYEHEVPELTKVFQGQMNYQQLL